MKCVIFYLLTGMLLLSCATKVQKNENENTSQVIMMSETTIIDENESVDPTDEVNDSRYVYIQRINQWISKFRIRHVFLLRFV